MNTGFLTTQLASWRRFASACTASGKRAGQIRAQQISTIARLGPYMMSANVICAIMVCAIFWKIGNETFLIFWSLIIPYSILLGYRSYRLSRRPEARQTASKRSIKRVVVFAIVTGLMWGVLPIALFPGASAAEQVFLTCLAAGMLCGTGFALATVPSASLAAVAPIALGSIVALALDHNSLWLVNSLLVVIYACAIQLTAALQGQKFIDQLLTLEKMEEQKETIHLLLNEFEDNSSDWLWETNRKGELVNAPNRMGEVLCQSPYNLLGRKLTDLFLATGHDPDGQSSASIDQLRASLATGEAFRDLAILTTINSQRKWISLTGRPLRDRTGNVTGYRGVGSDVTTERAIEARLEHLARNDSLTGVANRMYFRELLAEELANANRTGHNVSVFSLDLDDFKLINDTRGHPFGDALLRSVANRMVKHVGNHGIIGRIGGDEFAILLHADRHAVDARVLAERLLKAFAIPFEIDGTNVCMNTSMGIRVALAEGNDVDSIMKDADLALYEAKKAGRNRYRIFETDMGRHLRLLRSLEVDLKGALDNDQLCLHYQPLVNSSDREICGFEALMRWQHPEHGLISPAEFIPMAERTGEIATLGGWAIQQACRAVVQWPSHMTVAINISPMQFYNNDVCDVITNAINRTGISPDRLELEITEGVLIRDTGEVLNQLRKLKKLGVSIALDDFGTGYSSLSYLWRFPFDKIKIDQSFVSALGNGAGVEEILRSIVLLAQSMKARVVAEGVETPYQAKFLSELGCDQLQGYLFGRPQPDYENALLLLDQVGKHNLNGHSKRQLPETELIA